MKIPIGDVLEWAAGTAFVTAAVQATGESWAGWLVAGVVLAYEAQCYGGKVFAVDHLGARLRVLARVQRDRLKAWRAQRQQS